MSKATHLLIDLSDLTHQELITEILPYLENIHNAKIKAAELTKENINNLIGGYMFTNMKKTIAEQHFELTDLIMKELLKIES